MIKTFRGFLRMESANGIILVGSAVAAMIIANSPLSGLYTSIFSIPVEVRVGTFDIAKPLLLWINDGLMAVFFLLIGLELKREILEGQLSDRSMVALPAAGALGGMVVPALIYFWINRGDPIAVQGWAIPAATDIAFALAIITLLGNRVPIALRLFLVSIAIFDDVGAIVIIALFYTSDITMTALIVALACYPILVFLNRKGVLEIAPYLFVGTILWIAVLKSGVHATLAGIILAFFIPMRDQEKGRSPLHELEHDLHFAVAFLVLPIFAFANAGVSLQGLSFEYLLHPVPLGILAGLFIGKQVGVFSFCWITVKLGYAKLPDELTWVHLYGTALLCGVGFTMSLFIGSLAFEATGVDNLFDERLGIIAGSILAGAGGYLVLRFAKPKSS